MIFLTVDLDSESEIVAVCFSFLLFFLSRSTGEECGGLCGLGIGAMQMSLISLRDADVFAMPSLGIGNARRMCSVRPRAAMQGACAL